MRTAQKQLIFRGRGTISTSLTLPVQFHEVPAEDQ